ncbi:MAG: undecaprenyl-phosphate glucose phosphotransferase [Deltaproteobacteria bacterium GWC2_56_8]|nr:MAG: undecaprenyl-phosphate glucose phosphotransferase [Deltaproteobacteria bacterium GWB2_55_19]OGP38751.1 MAG: undecaprenyl-phosphate glucose phosphotransferase [Deltaproteobacteria bacterium GWC2_56_8]HAO93804.1 undecaprenyl-phosphate glucose phosphotransferase [Deltaproteobacteria bacterium]
MLKKHSQLFESLLFISDLLIIAFSWVASFYIRFYSGLPVEKGVPDFYLYCLLLIPIVVIWGFAFKGFGLYRPKRIGSHLSEVFDITKACVISALILISITFFFRHYEFSRLVFLFFVAINIISLSLARWTFREVLRYLRRKGHNIRFAVIIGTGEPAVAVVKSLERHPEVGIKLLGVVGTTEESVGTKVAGATVLDTYKNLRSLMINRRIDQIFIALTWDEHAKVVEVLSLIGDEAVDIKVIPDLFEFMTLRGGVEEFDGMPILNLQNSPLYGWNMILKRSADVLFASAALVVVSPLMLALSLLIKLTSPGPVLFRQERMGIGGDTFQILKFRSMRADAEDATGAVWASKDDPRRTRLGTLLRSTSLDELPQLFNVLRGDMSLVGPRPERPVFIREFRKNIPNYMLRHKMKAGITGWAQVNGWRGNTDLGKRIEHDLYYIENWSLVFDIKILFLTLWKGLVNRNAY